MSETKLMALREAVNLAMSEEMRKDENIFLMGEDVGIYGGDFGTSVGMLAEFGEKRVRDTPISEAAILTDSWNEPSLVAPSPEKTTTMFPVSLYC